ncbi:hypothetical protein HMPREF3192_00097 [Atopobium deltae]|uniref:Uncharacterized protein n=1 Tax=Atopobium deltae TaxID=1393034 RepID=A0A133XXM3_9ACTN|nr:hypothetical protein HMPREF3192_00097 [Atopobium deltae]
MPFEVVLSQTRSAQVYANGLRANGLLANADRAHEISSFKFSLLFLRILHEYCTPSDLDSASCEHIAYTMNVTKRQ